MDGTTVVGRSPISAVMPRAAAPRVAAAAAALVLLLSLLTGAVADPSAGARAWIVDADRALPDVARVVQHLPIIDSVVVTSPVPITGAVPVDSGVHPQSLMAEPVASGELVDSGVAATGAPDVWGTTRGERAVVALIDTGVAPVPALEGAVAGEIDFTGTGGGDGFGHGTFLASIIAGRGNVATGVAPGAGILSLKVSDGTGATTLGAVLSALQWLHGPGKASGIRIAALAMAVEPGTEAAILLDRAVDRLARGGVLVVTASGNDGPSTLTSPATAVGTFSVGVVEADGTAPEFSGRGPDSAGVTQPDVSGPGVSVVGSLPTGSVIAGTAAPVPGHEGLYTGTGTSMATAMAAGVAALASSARPDLDGHALESAIRAAGPVLDAPGTVSAATAAPAAPGRSGTTTPNGNATGANGDGKGNGNGQGTADPQSIRWTSIRWTSIRWTGEGWGDGSWGVAAWGSIRWTGISWAYAGPTPQSIRWTSIRWTWAS